MTIHHNAEPMRKGVKSGTRKRRHTRQKKQRGGCFAPLKDVPGEAADEKQEQTTPGRNLPDEAVSGESADETTQSGMGG